MKRRAFTSGRTRFWRKRFVQIAREMDAASAGKAPAGVMLALRARAAGPATRVRGRPASLAGA
jgi:hypothetical protein